MSNWLDDIADDPQLPERLRRWRMYESIPQPIQSSPSRISARCHTCGEQFWDRDHVAEIVVDNDQHVLVHSESCLPKGAQLA